MIRIILAALLVFSLNLIAFADVAPTFTLKGLNSDGKEIGRFYFENVNPGDQIESKVRLILYDDVMSNFAIRADGIYKDWFEISEGNVILDTASAYEIPVLVNIPPDATPGDYKILFRAELLKFGEDSGVDTAGKTTGLAVNQATGMYYEISVNGDRTYDILLDSVNILEWNRNQGTPVEITYSNNGNTLVNTSVVLNLFNFKGELIHEYLYKLPDVSVNESRVETVFIEPNYKSSFLPYNAELELVYDYLDSDGQIVSASAGIASFNVGTYTYLVISVFAIIIILFSFIYFKKRRNV